MKSFLHVVVFLFCITLGQFVHAQAWEATNEWDGMATELEYQQWFLNNVNTDFYFKKTGYLQGEVGVDCGKAAYVARAVFAFETKRRFLARDRDNKVWIDSSAKVAYTGTPEQKLRNFLRTEIVARVNVESMKYNTFPIEVSRGTLTAGTVFNFQMPGQENNEAGRHAYIVKEISSGGYIKFIWATVPIAPRMMSERTLYPVYMPTNVSINNQWGFRRFYQPKDYIEGVLDLRKSIPLTGGLTSVQAMDAEIKLQSLLRSRGYSSTYQNDLAKEVLNDLEVEKESRRVVGTFATKPQKTFLQSPNRSLVAEVKDYMSYITPSGTNMSAPGWKPFTLLDAMELQSRKNLDKMLGIGQSSAVDQLLEIARARQAELDEQRRPRPKIVRNITFPPLKENGTFVSDPDNLVEGVSVIRIYHEKLITLLQNKEETLEQNLQRQYFNLCSYLQDRQSAVEEGYIYYFITKKIVSSSNVFNRCPTEEEFYNFTTPNRDSEFKDYVQNLKNFYEENRELIKKTLPDWYLTMEYSLGEPMHVQMLSVASNGYAKLQNSLNATRQYLPKQQTKNYCEIMLDLRNGKQEPMSIRRFVPILGHTYTFVNAKSKAKVPVPLISVLPSTSIERRWGIHGLNQELYDLEYNLNIDCTGQSQQQHGSGESAEATEKK